MTSVWWNAFASDKGVLYESINPFYAIGLLLYLRFSDVFRGYKNDQWHEIVQQDREIRLKVEHLNFRITQNFRGTSRKNVAL